MDKPSEEEVKQALLDWREAHSNLEKAMSKFISLDSISSMPTFNNNDLKIVKKERETFDKYQELISRYTAL